MGPRAFFHYNRKELFRQGAEMQRLMESNPVSAPRFHTVATFVEFANLLAQLFQLVVVFLAFNGFALDLQLTDTAFYLVQLLRHRV